MAESTARSPKSSLAASRATAAPWGIPVPVKPKPPVTAAAAIPVGAARPLTAGAIRSAPAAGRSGSGANTETAAAPRQRTTGAGVRVVRQARVRSVSEQRTIIALIAAGVGLLLALSAMGAQAKFAVSASEKAIGGTLGRASLAQMEFRSRHERFALWEELEANGMRLPEDVTVLHSNASMSHWYVRLQDRATGVTCERLGQLIDPPNEVVDPTCTRAR
jgi:hypothetical protein